ncbi:hypothetical protein [Priestia endophytica]|uniref:Uncharacterized protein n=1 Tax=Priestia endophytica TaxID=135735 RepID=A0AAX1QBW1_9BACI|nr:hypothetical protein [Priestia endophytica]RAS76658.1 hypothetical protein A3864_12605 [Priestia endophytica]
MDWETLPNWFWFMYYLFLLLTLGTAILSMLKRKKVFLCLCTIVSTITFPIISLINTIGRAASTNELEHLLAHLQHGEIWAWYVVGAYLLIFTWWIVFFIKNNTFLNRRVNS